MLYTILAYRPTYTSITNSKLEIQEFGSREKTVEALTKYITANNRSIRGDGIPDYELTLLLDGHWLSAESEAQHFERKEIRDSIFADADELSTF